MLIATILSGGCTLTGSPSPDYHRLTQEAQAKAKAEARGAEEIPCPGGCGGMAWLETSPVLILRDGQERTVRIATCAGSCRTEYPSRNGGRTILRATRFEIEEMSMGNVLQMVEAPFEKERAKVQAALDKTGATISFVAALLKLPPCSTTTWLRSGLRLGVKNVKSLMDWVDKVELGHWPPEGMVIDVQERRREKRRQTWDKKNPPSPEADRLRLRSAVALAGITLNRLSTILDVRTQRLSQWVHHGRGLTPERVGKVMAWLEQVEQGKWQAFPPVDTSPQDDPKPESIVEEMTVTTQEPASFREMEVGSAEAMPAPTEPPPRVADVLLAGVIADLETIVTEHLERLSPTVAKRVRVRVILEEVA